MEKIELDEQFILNDYGFEKQVMIIKDADGKYIVEEY